MRKTVTAEVSDHTHISDDGQPIDVDTFHIGWQPYWMLTHYGCNVAVTLLLRFTRELAIVMMLMFALNAYGMADNKQRSRLRSRCRAALDGSYANLTANASEPGACCSECGYAGLAINPALQHGEGRDRPFYLDYGLGSCSEYLAVDVPVVEFPSPDLAVFRGYNTTWGKLASVPDSDFCTPSSVGLWLELAGLATLLIFLVRQRRINRLMAEASDQQQISAAGVPQRGCTVHPTWHRAPHMAPCTPHGTVQCTAERTYVLSCKSRRVT